MYHHHHYSSGFFMGFWCSLVAITSPCLHTKNPKVGENKNVNSQFKQKRRRRRRRKTMKNYITEQIKQKTIGSRIKSSFFYSMLWMVEFCFYLSPSREVELKYRKWKIKRIDKINKTNRLSFELGSQPARLFYESSPQNWVIWTILWGHTIHNLQHTYSLRTHKNWIITAKLEKNEKKNNDNQFYVLIFSSLFCH
jgi:hypothetical protein